MVREIIQMQVGQCGNQIGSSFWETVRHEHCLSEDGSTETKEDRKMTGTEKMGVYFRESTPRSFKARCVLIDLEPGTMDAVQASALGAMFRSDNFVFGSSGAGNNWAKGHYTEGVEVADEVMDVVRLEMEACNCPQGVQLTHSLGGGTGSGLGTLLLLKLQETYPDRLTTTFSVTPSTKVSDVVVEPYNALLSMHQLLEVADQTSIIDNESLFGISQHVLRQENPKYRDLNWLVSQVMSGVTSSLRFTGQLNGDLRKMAVNLVPFPRLHFFLVAQAPLLSQQATKYTRLSVRELTTQMWSRRNFLADVKPEEGKFLASACTYRGAGIAPSDVDREIARLRARMDDRFVEWIPSNIKTSVIGAAPRMVDMSSTFVSNHTALKAIFQRISRRFLRMYKRQAFVHWYTGEGMEATEFEEADRNIRDLVCEYQDKEDAVVQEGGVESDDDEEEEDEDDEEFDDF